MKIRPEIITLLEENKGTKLIDAFLKSDSKNESRNAKIKRFCTAKETINRMKMQPTGREKIFANHISDKGLIFKICKEFIKFNSKKLKSSV